MNDRIRELAGRLDRVLGELARQYQFRDRDEICCHGISVSQCYAMELIDRNGPMPMGWLACELNLDVSTMTRVIAPLSDHGHVRRRADRGDRRVVRVELTRKGRALVQRVRGELMTEYAAVLERLAPDHGEALVAGIAMLLDAFKLRTSKTTTCNETSGEEPCQPTTKSAETSRRRTPAR